jgi:hypothetical protein
MRDSSALCGAAIDVREAGSRRSPSTPRIRISKTRTIATAKTKRSIPDSGKMPVTIVTSSESETHNWLQMAIK